MRCSTQEQARLEYERAVHAGTAVRVRVLSNFDTLQMSDLPTLPMGDHGMYSYYTICATVFNNTLFQTDIPEAELSSRWYSVTVGRHPGIFNGP